LLELDGPEHQALGLGDGIRHFEVATRRLEPGDRLLLVSDGVLDRVTHGGDAFGLDGVRAALTHVDDPSPAPTIRALEDAITGASADMLQDDATLVVFAPSSPQ
jgi:serine phosphatase RsbU (regulator of sigma subunit)